VVGWWLKQVDDVACCTGVSSDMVSDVGKASKRRANEGAGDVQMHKPAKAGAAKFENCRQAPTSHEYAEEGNVTVSSFIVSHGALSHLPLDQPEHDSHEDAGLQEAGNPTVVRAYRPKLQRCAPLPPSGFMTPPQPVDITLTLGLEFSKAGSKGSQERSNFERTLVRELTQATGIPREVQTCFVIKQLSPGSVVVDLSILAPVPRTDTSHRSTRPRAAGENPDVHATCGHSHTVCAGCTPPRHVTSPARRSCSRSRTTRRCQCQRRFLCPCLWRRFVQEERGLRAR